MSKAISLMAALMLTEIAASAQATDPPSLDPAHPIFGTLQSSTDHLAATNAAGARAVVVGLTWDRFEPRESVFDAAYADQMRRQIDAFRAGGKLVVLDLGIQYAPRWIFASPAAHFVDQYGQAFEPKEPGECGVNLVFSAEMRSKLDAYVHEVFADLGHDFFAVRLGGGRYGELGYPGAEYAGERNCYWAFDTLAQGGGPGLPRGLTACPVAGWKPGTTSPDHAQARAFLNWYMEGLRNYHDWQIQELRRYFSGPLLMLYPSTGGLRPGQLEAAIGDDAAGRSAAEKTGEVSRGYDTARFIAGISDPNVVVYSTWVDGFPFCDDSSADQARWNPAHYLAHLAADHVPPLLCGGENTGHPDDVANMELTFQHARDAKLCLLFWAFEPDLFRPGRATCDDLRRLILGDGAAGK
ncbi:MAG TPA: hypothetical protein VHY09_14615 [Candidatus Methylacidiphilales bacterium]|jgi:hypothetical protein|nr:hypothetical protein [Candidatus Methylacidiphilales bacterium]